MNIFQRVAKSGVVASTLGKEHARSQASIDVFRWVHSCCGFIVSFVIIVFGIRIAVLMKCTIESKYKPVTAEYIDKTFDEMEKETVRSRRDFVTRIISSELERLFRSVHKFAVNGKFPGNVSLDAIIADAGFATEIKQSLVPNAGLGCFYRGPRLPPGSVVTLFPGVVHLPEFLTTNDAVNQLLPDDNLMVMSR